MGHKWRGWRLQGGCRSAGIRGFKNQQISVLGKWVPGAANSKEWLGEVDWCVWQACEIPIGSNPWHIPTLPKMMSPWNPLQEKTLQKPGRGARTAPTWCLTPGCGVRNRIVWAGAGPAKERSSFLGNCGDSEMVKCATTATETTAVWQKEWGYWHRQVVCLLSQRSIRGCPPLEEGQGLGL